jgi:hypothetical protein
MRRLVDVVAAEGASSALALALALADVETAAPARPASRRPRREVKGKWLIDGVLVVEGRRVMARS